jgi:NADP-dependent 3-hydroxy acid dehydrogenase YdfG
MSKVVLITGCSSGIGHCLAKSLSQSGYTVVATARSVEALTGLPAALKLPLDVTNPDSINEAIAKTLQEYGRIDVLINNAGYAMLGALEEVSDEQTRQVFDVNVFGPLRMIRAVVPQMRKQGTGYIINISSIAGKLSTPANGTYSATKFALEALSDALRLELSPFRIQVVVIEPGAIQTRFDDTAQVYAKDILFNPASPYLMLYQQNEKFATDMRRHEAGPEAVCNVIKQVLNTQHPKPRYLAAVNLSSRLVLYMRDFMWEPLIRQMFKINTLECSHE